MFSMTVLFPARGHATAEAHAARTEGHENNTKGARIEVRMKAARMKDEVKFIDSFAH
jgi:hypothetical protein